MRKITNVFFSVKAIKLFVMIILLPSCAIFQQKSIVEDLGVTLGSTSQQVNTLMGKPKFDFTFHTTDHDISVWEYDREQKDYVPILEDDDYGVIAPSPGIRQYSERQCRLVFVDGYLCSIEDFVRDQVMTIDRNQLPDNIPAILDEIHER